MRVSKTDYSYTNLGINERHFVVELQKRLKEKYPSLFVEVDGLLGTQTYKLLMKELDRTEVPRHSRKKYICPHCGAVSSTRVCEYCDMEIK